MAGSNSDRHRPGFAILLPFLPLLFVTGALLSTAASTLSVYPHQLAYFNELAGGLEYGHRHLLGSSLDWGQDSWFLLRYVEHQDLSGCCRVAILSSTRNADEVAPIQCAKSSELPTEEVAYVLSPALLVGGPETVVFLRPSETAFSTYESAMVALRAGTHEWDRCGVLVILRPRG